MLSSVIWTMIVHWDPHHHTLHDTCYETLFIHFAPPLSQPGLGLIHLRIHIPHQLPTHYRHSWMSVEWMNNCIYALIPMSAHDTNEVTEVQRGPTTNWGYEIVAELQGEYKPLDFQPSVCPLQQSTSTLPLLKKCLIKAITRASLMLSTRDTFRCFQLPVTYISVIHGIKCKRRRRRRRRGKEGRKRRDCKNIDLTILSVLHL